MAKGLSSSFTSFPHGKKPGHHGAHAEGTRLTSAFDGYPKGSKPPQYKGDKRKLELRDKPQGAPAARTIEAASATDADPYGSHYFALEIVAPDGTYEVAHFLEFSGLKSSCTPFEITEGGFTGHVHRRPAISRWDNITLKYATSVSTFMMYWRNEFLSGNFDKRTQYSGSIALMSNQGTVVRRFHFVRAWPVSWESPALSAGGSDLAIETLVLAHDGIYVDEAALSTDMKVG